MTNSSREDLLGYMLGALDATETQEIENQIQQNVELQRELEELESMVAPLENLETPPAPSVGLARRTIEYVAGKSRSTSMAPSVEIEMYRGDLAVGVAHEDRPVVANPGGIDRHHHEVGKAATAGTGVRFICGIYQ